MRIREFLQPDAVSLDLAGSSRDEALAGLVALLRLPAPAAETVRRQLVRRESLGTTGFGRGVTLPHCRTLAASRLRLAFGLHRAGVEWQAMDGKPVHTAFLIVAPPMEVSNQYLPVLGRIAQFLHEPQVPERLRTLTSPEALFELLDQRGL